MSPESEILYLVWIFKTLQFDRTCKYGLRMILESFKIKIALNTFSNF